MRSDAEASEIQAVVAAAETLGYRGHPITGSNRTAVCITGNKGSIDPTHFENLSGVADVVRITRSYRLASLEVKPDPSIVPVGDAFIGGPDLALIAGPCALEDREQVFSAAETVAASGARFFRGGAYKPRTSPYAFQGLGEEGLKILAEVRERYKLNIVTEAMDEAGVDAVERYGDCIQIGARNMQNFSLLKYVGRTDKPVLLKRGPSATLEELLLAAEYIMAEGNHNVILCERGIRTFSDHSRNTLDLAAIPALRRLTHLPVIVDPSHGTGHSYMVAPLALAGIAAGANGVIVEVHPQPAQARCDGAQALAPESYLELASKLRAIHDIVVTTENVLADTHAF